MIEISQRRILLGGEPRLVLAGEIHYFRIPRAQWGRRLDLLVESGCTAVASYIPWMWHELPDGTIDVAGTTSPERDLGAFLDLCQERGLQLIARPGPFQMAELMHEGLPARLYREHPEIVPTGWDGEPASTSAVDYLAPAFLAEADRWFAAVLPVIAPRLITRGGPVLAVQLDNEIGMLAWVSNTPDLTDNLLEDLRGWILDRRPDAEATYPAISADAAAWADAVRRPDEAWAGPLRNDLTRFMRGRFARYVRHLRASAEALGISGVPFLVNIHGTEAGGGEPFPIGISQLMETYAGVPGMVSGSDHYVGTMTLTATTDLYVMNAFQQAVHDADQVLTSLEFEAGSGDYGGGFDQQYEPSTAALKTRLFLAQGARLLNYYLLAGGINPPMPAADARADGPAPDAEVGGSSPGGDGPADGIGRISFTGERHGTAAPITPDGDRSPTFAPLASAIAAARMHERFLATAQEEHDDLALAFVPDSYATEYAHPRSARMQEVVEDLRSHRGAGQRRALARSALLQGYRFGAVALPAGVGGADEEARSRLIAARPRPRVLMLAASAHLAPEVQSELVAHLDGGGGLLVLGTVPERDLDGAPCRILADHLGIRPLEPVSWDRPGWYPTVAAQGWAGPLPQTRAGWVQGIAAEHGEVILHDLQGRTVGVDIELPAGRAVVITAGLPSSPELFGRALERLGARPGLPLRSSAPGVFTTSTADAAGNRLLHVLNTSGHRPEVRLGDGEDVLALRPAPHTGYMLAHGLTVAGTRIVRANAELTRIGEDELAFGEPAGDEAVLVLEPGRTILSATTATGPATQVDDADGRTVIRGAGSVTLRLGAVPPR